MQNVHQIEPVLLIFEQLQTAKWLVVRVDGIAAAVLVGVELLIAVDINKQFPFDVCLPCLEHPLTSMEHHKKENFRLCCFCSCDAESFETIPMERSS